MRLFLLLAALAMADQAPKAKHNPKNIIAVADFPEVGSNTFTKGYVFFTSRKGGAVKVHVDMTGLPQSGGPFFYHIHEKQVFSGQDCDDAGAAFDPYAGLQKCPRVGDDAFCQVGDLSGKHGWINATCYQAEYTDPYLALNPDSAAYIVGRSLVFHNRDLSRFACANINIATREQYEALFGYNSVAESEGVLEFQEEDAESRAVSDSASERENSLEADVAPENALQKTEPQMEGSKETAQEESQVEGSKETAQEEPQVEGSKETAQEEPQVEGSKENAEAELDLGEKRAGNSSGYVPAEGGAGSVFSGVFGTAIGLVLGFFF